MGVSLTVGGEQYGQWSYSGFNFFRRKLAREIDLNLDLMAGFTPDFKDILETQGWEAYRDKKLEWLKSGAGRSWDTIDDPIVPLLHHSDCNGIISPEDCATVGPRLAELIKDWPETIAFDTSPEWQAKGYPAKMTLDDHDTTQARRLVEGMKRAAQEGLPLEFH